MIKPALLTLVLTAALAGPALAQTAPAAVLPDDPGLKAVACSAILSATAQSMGASGGPMAEELTQFAGRWQVQARALLAAQGRGASEVDGLISTRVGQLYAGPGQGLPKGTFVSAQRCQADAEHLPAS